MTQPSEINVAESMLVPAAWFCGDGVGVCCVLCSFELPLLKLKIFEKRFCELN